MPTLKKSAPKKAKRARAGSEMRKFASGTLKSSSGQKVTNPAQAKAIAMSESGQSNRGGSKTQPPTDEKRLKIQGANTAAKKRRKRNIGRS